MELDPAVSERLRRNDAGLVPAIAQQHDTGEVLMLGWMDDEALARTLATGRATYWSRSRGEYWVKGETSGHRQWVKAVRLDCDGDTVLLQVDQEGPGVPHRRPHVLRRRPAVGGGRRVRGGAWLTAAACSLPPSSSVSPARAWRRWPGASPGPRPTARPAPPSSTTPAATCRWPVPSDWWPWRAGASSSSPGLGYDGWSPPWAPWSQPGSSPPWSSAARRRSTPRAKRPSSSAPAHTSAHVTGWWWLALVGSLLALAAAVLAVRFCGTWPEMGSPLRRTGDEAAAGGPRRPRPVARHRPGARSHRLDRPLGCA